MPLVHFNIVSLQRLRAAKFIHTFDELPGKAVIRNAQGGMVALMSESKSGRLTLDCKILSTATPLPPNRLVEEKKVYDVTTPAFDEAAPPS